MSFGICYWRSAIGPYNRPTSDVHVLLGPNRFALTEERRRWTSAFCAKHGEENLRCLEDGACTLRALIEDVSVAPFLGDKRLVVVEGVPKGTKDDVSMLRSFLHPSVLLMFVIEGELGKRAKRTATEREILAHGQVREFPLPSRSELSRWMEEEARSCGGTFEPGALEYLLSIVGEDQQLLASEIQKLVLYAAKRSVTEGDVSTLTVLSTERDVWRLMDLLGAGKVQEALLFSQDLLDRGASPQAVWNMFLWMVLTLVKLKGLMEDGERNPWAIARTLRVNAASVKAMLPFAANLSRDGLLRIVGCVLEADRGLKTGQYRSSAGSAEEQMALLDRAILAFGRC